MAFSESMDLKKGLSYSAGAHVALFIILIFLGHLDFFSLFSIDKAVKIRSAVKVDVVGMPTLTVQELKRLKLPDLQDLEATPSTRPQVPAQTAPVVKDELTFSEKKKTPSKKVDLADLINQMSQKKVKAQKKIRKSKPETVIDEGELKKLVLEGNKVSKGHSLVSTGKNTDLDDFSQYAAQIPEYVRPNWRLPSYLQNKDLRGRIRISVGKNGKLIKAVVIESSGNEEFDRKAMQAIREVQSFPAPPQNIRHKVSAGDIVLGFPL